MNVWRNNVFSISFFNKQLKQCLEIGILQYVWKRSCFFIFLILIFSNHKLINLLFVIHLFVRVFRSLSMHFLFFCQKCRLLSILLQSILLFFVLFNILLMFESIYLLGLYQNLCEFVQRTLFLNFNMKHMTTDIFLRSLFYFWIC